MWIVNTNGKQIYKDTDLLDSLLAFVYECEDAIAAANPSNPITVSLIQQVKQDNGAVAQFPYFTNSYK